MRSYLWWLLPYVLFFTLQPFSDPSSEEESCYTDHLHQQLLATDTAYRQQWEEMEQETYRKLSVSPLKSGGEVCVLPVVFHIIHQNGSENLTDAQIQQALTQLNAAFANTGYYDQDTGVDTDIQFCLARRDPEGNPTTGINRIESALTELDADNDDLALKDLSRWAPRDYINIWVVRDICGLGAGCNVLGYAYYPSAHGTRRDGLVVEAAGLTGGEVGITTTVHEIGHYLGLYHTFEGGCENNDCLRDGDRVCDTPPDNSRAAIPCTATANSCSTDANSGLSTDHNDMFNNYMDYGHARCYNAFTAGQRERMHHFLEGRRRSLLESKGCLEPCMNRLVANFSGLPITLNVGSSVSFQNESENADTYSWTINGEPFSTLINPVYTFTQTGTFTLELTISSDDPACEPASFSQVVVVECPFDADFSAQLGEDSFFPGDTLRLTAPDNRATHWEWSLNGVQVGTAADLMLELPNDFPLELCLELGGMYCTATYCESLNLVPPPATCLEGSFAKRYNFYSQADIVLPNTTSANGDYYLIGNTVFNSEPWPLISRLSAEGEVLSSDRLSMEFPAAYRAIQITGASLSGSHIHLSGFISGSTVEPRAVAFYYDPAARESFGWTIGPENSTGQAISSAALDQFSSIWSYTNWQTGSFNLGLKRAISFPTPFPRYTHSTGTLDIFSVKPTSDYILAAGHLTNQANTNAGQAIVLAFDGHDYSQYATWHRALNPPAEGRFIVRDIATTTTKWAAIYTDENARGSDFYFARATFADTTTRCDWAYNYDLPELGDQVVEEVITLPDGYLIFGQATSGEREYFLIRTDFNGELRWAKAYDFGSSEVLRPRVSGNLRIAQRSFVFLAKHGDRVLIAKVNEDGEFLEDCYSVRDLEVVRQPAPTQLYPLLINEETGTITSSTERLPATSLALAVLQETCEPLCETTEVCERPYLTRYETIGDSTTVFNCIAESAQQTWIGGSVHYNTMSVSEIDQGGYPKWTTLLSGFGVVQGLAMGQDGFLYGVGIHESFLGPIRYPVYFKLHPLTGRPAWVYSFSESSTRPTALAELPDGRWVGVGETYSGGEGCNGWLFFFDQNGNLLRSEQYDIGTCETWRDVVVDTEREQILVYGRVNLRRGGDAGLRPGLAAFSFAGDLLWSKYYGVDNQRNAIMEGHFLLLEGDRRWLLSTENGIGIGPGIINLTYTNVEGVPLRQHAYYLPEGVKGSSIVHAANGSKLILARPYQANKPGAYLFQIDTVGEVQWARYYPSYEFPKRARNLIRAGDTQITLIGQTEDIQGTPLGTIISLNLDGTTVAECLPWEDIEVERREGSGFVAPLELSHRELPGRTTAEEAAASLLSVHHSSCWQDCELVEICDNGQDDDGDSLVDCDDQDLANTCCCLPPQALSLGPDTLICPGGPLSLAPLPGPWRFFHWSDGSRADSLTVYEAGTYHLEAIDSCGRIGRDTLVVFARELPLLDLGPDTTLCANAVVPIEAGSDFESYRWVTGSTESRITAYQAGAYWVEVTDSCGQVQHDTLVVHIDPATEIELGRDTLICPGDTLVLSLSGFQRYQWSRSSYLSCDSCALVRFAPTQDTLLLVAAERGPGCISSDSLRVRVLDPTGSRQQMVLCPGDSVSFFGQTLKEAGQYYHVQQAANCSRTDTLDLAIFTDTLQVDSLRLCAGDSILVFDRYEREAGTYEEVYQNVLGCDSISRVVVEMFPTVLTTDSLRLCAGDSVWLFNNYVRETAWYEATFQTPEGCDSTHRVYVQFDSLELNLTQIRTACAQAAVGELQATVTGGVAPYDFRWSTGAVGAHLQELAAGAYTLTVSDVNGCAATGTIAVERSPLAAFSAEVFPERCPGAADGQLWLSAQSDDLLFRIDGSPFRADTIWTGLAVGEHLLQVRDAADCTDSLSFRVTAARPLVLELPAQISVALGDSVHLQPLHNQGDSARLDWWWPVEQSCLDCPELSLLPWQTMDVQLVLTTRDSCMLAGQTRIYVDERQIAYVPNAFSPNGDGVNDLFWLYPTPAVRTVRKLQIFDRWGGLAYTIKNADPTDRVSGWDGRVRGQDCNAGVFVYTLEVELVNGEVVTLNGELMLLR